MIVFRLDLWTWEAFRRCFSLGQGQGSLGLQGLGLYNILSGAHLCTKKVYPIFFRALGDLLITSDKT